MIERIDLHAIRSWRHGGAGLGPGPQILWGDNGAGKTTLLEACIVAAAGRSYRATALRDLLRGDEPAGAITVTVGPGARDSADPLEQAALGVEIPRSGRVRHSVAGQARAHAALAERLKVVAFVPEEAGLVVDAPAVRRAAIDRAAAQWRPGHGEALHRYEQTLRQRNRLLKELLDADGGERRARQAELRAWTEQLVESGADVVAGRLALLEGLAAPLAAAHREIAPAEGALAAAYVSREGHAPAAQRDAIAAAILRALGDTAEAEGYQGTTLVGPHRDDVAFSIDGRDLAPTASRGQQRTLLLALLFAQITLLTDRAGRPPVLLLDDVFSELDPARRDHLVERLADLPQALITTTTLGDLSPGLVARSATHHVLLEPGAGSRVAPA